MEEKPFEKDIRKILELITKEQEINQGRYQELKSSIDDVHRHMVTMVTKMEFNAAFDALSQDMVPLSGDQRKMRLRVDRLEKRVDVLESHAGVEK